MEWFPYDMDLRYERVNYFRKTIHRRCLVGFSIRIWFPTFQGFEYVRVLHGALNISEYTLFFIRKMFIQKMSLENPKSKKC